MRVAITIDDLDRRRGGMSEWCYQFINAIARRGYELHVVAQGFGEDALPNNIIRHAIPRTRSRLELAARCETMLRAISPDVAHDTGIGWHFDVFQPHGGSYAAWVARRLDMYPAWFRFIKRPIDSVLPRQRGFSRHWFQQCSAIESSDATIIALSNLVANDFAATNRIRPNRITVIHNGVDCQRFSPVHRGEFRALVRHRLGIDDETLVLLIAAHNFRLKGVPELLRTAARLVKNGRCLHVVVAGGRHLERWRLAAARLGIGKNVTFLGTISDLVPYYSAADAYVHPTYYDPCSLVLLEAAASGLPIVTTRQFNGAVELFREDEEAFIVEAPTSTDALVERVDALFDERLRGRLGLAARRVALRNPIERNVAEIVRLYEQRGQRRMAA